MNILIYGAGGFIGINLIKRLSENAGTVFYLADSCKEALDNIRTIESPDCTYNYIVSNFSREENLPAMTDGMDIVYHLVSTTVPGNSNKQIEQELMDNVVATSRLLTACCESGVKKVIFLSSGGTVYGKEDGCPIPEDALTNPISSYGIQKLAIEKLLYLYNHMNGLDYRIIRLSNPYGPYQRPNGIQGVVTTFIYKAINGEELTVYGDGSVVRDYIYIDDAIDGIIKITEDEADHKLYNLGSGKGVSIRDIISSISKALDITVNVNYIEGRNTDVPVNYLDVTRFETEFGNPVKTELADGIRKTADFLKNQWK